MQRKQSKIILAQVKLERVLIRLVTYQFRQDDNFYVGLTWMHECKLVGFENMVFVMWRSI